MTQRRIQYQYMTFPEQTEPHGLLSNDKRCQACWYYYVLAQSAKEKVGTSIDDQILLEGEPWMDTHYVAQARSVCTIYGLESPDEMFKFWEYVENEASRLGLPRPAEEYKNPKRFII